MSKLDFARGDIIASKYEVVDHLDESPLGITYRVKHQKSGKFVRLTMLRPKIAGSDHKEQLTDIYQKLKEFAHSAVIKVGELGQNDGVAYFTAEDFEGQTLREFLSEMRVGNQQLELTEAGQITSQLLEGVDALHKLGFVLRGLRPEHVLVNVRRTGPRGKNFVARVKILHAGFWDLVPAATLAEDEFQRGEAQYLAPELKGFEPTATVRADMYSIGVIFYELITGTPPVGTFQMPATVRPDLPKHVNDVVELAIAQSPDDRYQTATDFLRGIQTTINLTEVGEEQRRPLVTPLGVGIGLILLFSAIVILWQMQPCPSCEEEKQRAEDATLRAEAQKLLAIPDAGSRDAILKAAPPNMRYIPAGPFIAGRMHYDPAAALDEPLAQSIETKAFLIDQFEYPNVPGGIPKHGVDFGEAKKLCEEQGKRLCSAAEWEKACKGPGSTTYGYVLDSGDPDVYDAQWCGDGLAERGYASGTKPECQSGYGAYDMSGNYREWTGTAPQSDKRRYVKGGKLREPELGSRCAFKLDESMVFQEDSLSFRCCRDIDSNTPWSPIPAPPATPPVP